MREESASTAALVYCDLVPPLVVKDEEDDDDEEQEEEGEREEGTIKIVYIFTLRLLLPLSLLVLHRNY